MDYDFIEPRYIRLLNSETLLRTKAEYREAARILSHTRAPGGRGFRRELDRATQIVENELKRRVEHVG